MNPTVPTPLENGSTIKRFRLLECAGEDLDGFLYRAEDLQSHRLVSIKEFFPPGLARRGPERVEPLAGAESDYSRMLARFIVVTNQLACIDHPALMRVDDYWLQDGTVYVQMPWYAGQSLQDVLGARKTPIEPAQLERWLGVCAEALKVVHRSRDLHGGLSPDRIMVLEDGQVVLSPLSTEQPMSMLAPQAAAGSEALAAMAASAGLMKRPAVVAQRSLPPWVALEQTELSAGEWSCGPWTDVYALAAIASLAISGKVPPNVFQRVEGVPAMTLQPAAALGYRPEFLDAVERGFSLYPAGRPHSISAFMVALGLKESPVVADVRAATADEAGLLQAPATTQPQPMPPQQTAAPTPPAEPVSVEAEASEWVEVEVESAPTSALTSADTAVVPPLVAEREASVVMENAAPVPDEPVAPHPPAVANLQLVPPVERPAAPMPVSRTKDRPGVLVWGAAAASIAAMAFFGPKVFGSWTGAGKTASAVPAAAAPAVVANKPVVQPAAQVAATPKSTAGAASATVAPAARPDVAQVKQVAPVVVQAPRPEPRKAEAQPQVVRTVVPPVRPRKPEVVEASVAAARPVVMRPVALAHQDRKGAAVRVSDACADALIRRTLDPSAAADTSPRNTCR